MPKPKPLPPIGAPLTIYQLAKLAGVAAPTASKALNGHPGVNEATRRRVMELAALHHYHPSRMARGLSRRKTENLGLIAVRRHGVPMFNNPYYSWILEGVEEAVAENDYNLLLSVVKEERVESLPKKVREKNVDGLLLLGWMPESLLDELALHRIPTVWIDPDRKRPQGFMLGVDNAGGISQAVAAMKRAGHQRIGYVSGQLSNSAFEERHSAFAEALKSEGLSAGEELVAEEGRELAPSQFRDFLRRPDRPAALVCCNDDHALKVLNEAQGLGLRVPQDLALCGFDDIEAAALSQPPLSTLSINKQSLGFLAVKRLLEIVQGSRKALGQEAIPADWVQRQSI